MVNGKVSRHAKEVRTLRQPSGDPNQPQERSRHETRPYPTDARRMAIHSKEQGVPMINPLPNRSTYPSERSIRRWQQKRRDEGHFHPYKRQGGRRARNFVGRDITLLSYYRSIHPEATSAEVAAYLWNSYGQFQNPPRFYSPSQITKVEQELGLSRKRASKTARQALARRVLVWRYNYWHCPLPLGIANVAARDMIDIDESVVNTDQAARGYGKSFRLNRVRYHGPYSREGGSVRVIMAISGDPQLGYRWTDIQEGRGGTTFAEFYNMIDRISLDLNQRQPGHRFVFLMDNLNIHHNAMISILLQARGHEVVYRAPYTPKDGPIEYVFNTLESALVWKMHEISTAADVARVLGEKIRSIREFSRYFRHVGYR